MAACLLWARPCKGQPGLSRKKPVAKNHPHKTPSEVIEKILEIRKEYQFGALSEEVWSGIGSIELAQR